MNELTRLINQQDREATEKAAYEAACSQVLPGSLSPQDICRLWSPLGRHEWHQAPGTHAREIVAAQHLPLMELAPGRWIVAHTV